MGELRRRPTFCPSEVVRLALGALLCLWIPGDAMSLDRGKALTQYLLENWGTKDGLRQHRIRAMRQTQDGYLWLATENGLVRFDGVRFSTLSSATDGLSHDYLNALEVGDDGSLWVGTYHGLSHLTSGAFTTYTDRNGLTDSYVRCLARGGGHLWIGGLRGLNRLENNRVTVDPRFTGEYVQALEEARDGTLWVATLGALSHVKGAAVITYTSRDGLPPDVLISDLFEGSDGTLWIASGDGLGRLANGVLSFFTTRDGLSSNSVSTVLEDRAGNVWVGTASGLDRFEAGRFSSLSRRNGMGEDAIESLYEDREGSLWIGLRSGGLSRLRDGRFATYGRAEGLSRNEVWSVYGSSDGSLWFGTDGGGLNRLKDGRITVYGTRHGLPGMITHTTAEGRDGGLWFGMNTHLVRWKDGQVHTYGPASGLPFATIRSVLEDSRGRLWVGTAGKGLYRKEADRFVRGPQPEGRSIDDIWVSTILEGRDGSVWFGTDAGLRRLQGDQLTVYTPANGLPGEYVSAVFEDTEGTLWVGTNPGGLGRLRNGHWATFRAGIGLLDEKVYAIVEDAANNLWFSSDRGIFYVAKRELIAFAEGQAASVTSHAFDERDGLRVLEGNGGFPAAWRSADGRIWFATAGGAVAIDPNNLRRNTVPSPVHIESLLVDRAPVPLRDGVRVGPGRGELEFKYTAPSLRVPDRVRFRYRLDGFDPGWVEAGTRRTAYYTNIPPGRYRFRVIASNDDGVWNQSGASVSFVRVPYFYETRWFYALGVGIGALLVLLAHRVRVRQLKTRERELTLLVEERTRAQEALRESHLRLEEAMDQIRQTQEHIVQQERLRALGNMASGIAHDFNNALAPIVGFTDLLLLHPNKLADHQRVRDYLNIVNTAAKDAAQVVGRLREFYRPRRKDEALHPVDLGSVVKQAIVLAQPKWKDQAQAAGITIRVETNLRKALRVAGNEAELRDAVINLIFNAVDAMPNGGTLTLTTGVEADTVVLEVRDTGTGMTEETRQRCLEPFFTTKGERGSGLGLAMVYGTVKRHNGTIEIRSAPAEGTTFVVRFGQEAVETSQGDGAAGPSSLQRLHALVVDDEPMNRRLITEYFESDRHSVETAASGSDALGKLRQQAFDVVVADRAMPGMSGDQFAVSAKKIRPDVPVILLTGFGELMRASGEAPEGVDLVVGKPVTLPAFREALRQVLHRSEG